MKYHSAGDERAFFEWLGRVSCIADIEGSGDEIVLHLTRKAISNANLNELIALFQRYEVDMAPLAQFESSRNRSWFKNPKAFWYERVFLPPVVNGPRTRR